MKLRDTDGQHNLKAPLNALLKNLNEMVQWKIKVSVIHKKTLICLVYVL